MSLENKYRDLATKATETTSVFSSIGKMMKEPSVQEIIELGVNVLPLVFKDLQTENHGCHWQMGVIRAILENNGLPPVEIPDEFRGRVVEMVRIHVEYGHDHGYI